MTIPESKPDKVVVKPAFCCTWFNGLACSYEEESSYDEQAFKGTLKKNEFRDIVDDINNQIFGFMPCPTMWCCAYLLAIPTLGLSLLLVTKCCIADATQAGR